MEVSAPFLPQSIATLISTVSLGARVSLRTAAIIVEALLESLQHGTSATLGISRRSLLAAVSTAKILNVLKGNAGPNDAFTMLLDKYTSLGVYVIHNSFTLAELFAISGLQLVSSTLTAGIRTAEESVRVVDGLFGSTETSRALAAVVGLVKKEMYEDQDFAITNAGRMAVLASITKAITVFACLQAATHKRTQKSIRAMLVYEGVVVTKPKKLGDLEGTQLATIGRRSSLEIDDDDSGELLQDLSNALVTDPDDVTQDMTTTQIEKVLSADILQVTTTTTLTTTTTQTFVRPGADLSKLGKPLPPIHPDREAPASTSLQRQHHYPGSIETTSSSRGASTSMAITARSRRGSVSSIASVATTLTQYATTSIVTNPHGSVNGSVRHKAPAASEVFAPSESLSVEGNRNANNNLRLMFSTVTKKFKKNQKVQVGEGDETVLMRTQEREIRTSEARNSLDWSEDDTDWIEVTKSSETTSSMEMNATLSYDVPLEKKGGDKFGSSLGIKNGLGSKKFGRSFFSKMTRQSAFGKSNERRSLDSSGPQLTITELDESRNDSQNSLTDRSTAATPTLVDLKLGNDDKDARPALPPKEPKEPNPANFPRDHLVRNIQRFMRYASASYGHNFMRILGIGTIGDAIYSPYGDHPNHHAFATHTSTPLDSILLSSFTDPGTKGNFQAPKMHSLVHYINLDHGAQCVVLTCRGTLGLSDVLTDLCAHYDDLVLPTVKSNGKRGEQHANPKYKVHAGMHASARLLSLETSTVFKTIKKALEDYPDYGLVLCGHSLGGGVAALLALLWSMTGQDFEAYVEEQEEGSSDEDDDEVAGPNGATGHKRRRRSRIIYPEITTPFVTSPASLLPAGRPIHCYAYGPPCVMSLPLSRYCRGLITTVVHQYDLVPTLSLGLLKDFKNVATTLHEEGQVVEDIVKRLIIGASSNKANAERQSEQETKVASTTYTSPTNGSGPTPPPTPPIPPKKDQHMEPPKRSQSMPMYSEYDRWQLQEAEDQDWSWSLIKTMRADMGSDKLYPPTPVYLLESIATTIVPPGSSSITATAGAVAATMASRSSAATSAANSVPLSKSYSASAAISAAGTAAASLANGLRPSSPFGGRSTTPTPSSKSKVSTSSTMPPLSNGGGSTSFMPQANVPKTAYKISMRKFDHVEERFGELQFARSMFTDHNPANYEVCVERLCQAVFSPEEHQ
ncbi:hypothetical protein EDD11_008043 [Mortierella claussenii]|nr:hypothetical protein EDD11_008043 [Mortierella claussenii]